MRIRARWFTHPTNLSPEAQKFWRLHGPGLLEAEILSDASVEDFKNLCRLLALASIAAAEIEAHGVTIETTKGIRMSNPAVGTLLSAQRAMAPLLSRFGMQA